MIDRDKAKIGSRVVYTHPTSEESGQEGTITDIDYHAARVAWDDELVSIVYLDDDDFSLVELAHI